MRQKEFKYKSYCSGYCGACPQFIATKNSTIESFAAERDITVDQVICKGCKSDVRSEWCKICHLRQCAVERAVDHCGECSDYPCEALSTHINDPNYPYHSMVPQQVIEIKEKGFDVWIAEQHIRWSCAACGAPYTWFDSICLSCSGKTRSWNE